MTQIRNKMQEAYKENHSRKVLQFLAAAKPFKDVLGVAVPQPPEASSFPTAKWFMSIIAMDIFSRIEDLLAELTGKFGTILKIDSTKKVCCI